MFNQKYFVPFLLVCVLFGLQGCLKTGDKKSELSRGQLALGAYAVTTESLETLKGQIMDRCKSGKMRPEKCQEMKTTFNKAHKIFYEAMNLIPIINNATDKGTVEQSQIKYDEKLTQLRSLLGIVEAFLEE